jgi:hypothetical protein
MRIMAKVSNIDKKVDNAFSNLTQYDIKVLVSSMDMSSSEEIQ